MPTGVLVQAGRAIAKSSAGRRAAVAAGQMAVRYAAKKGSEWVKKKLNKKAAVEKQEPIVSKYHEEKVLYARKSRRFSRRKSRANRFRKRVLSIVKGECPSNVIRMYETAKMTAAANTQIGATACLFYGYGGSGNRDLYELFADVRGLTNTTTGITNDHWYSHKMQVISGVMDVQLYNSHASNSATVEVYEFWCRKPNHTGFAVDHFNLANLPRLSTAGAFPTLTQLSSGLDPGYSAFNMPDVTKHLVIKDKRIIQLPVGESVFIQMKINKRKTISGDALNRDPGYSPCLPGWTRGYCFFVHGTQLDTTNKEYVATEVCMRAEKIYNVKILNAQPETVQIS